ncbi:hypothetical protein P152DRAFT_200350 [Eremomyces bilateralis CBS 781.70]|uniref:SAM and PH domain-containing protein n=1 Tax=Eremomyces bilateralis CBS 781.70 TaxID=1392243 RepID=A0A6G1GD99_9PEZI|nr:uncharacterized protein P152DRAFT_200350 [Eremomyces bilateralis CBS 781.70]KAF1815871.1 hypothetical protein P152DRAFT_200350 [Eremomyces bilateralis CBS 781.70]
MVYPVTPITPLEAGVEMFQRGKPQSVFIPAKERSARPLSECTEIFDTEVEDDQSAFEEDSEQESFQSNEGRRSQTTISTVSEVTTPQSGRRSGFNLQIDVVPAVEGPKGPHLFRASQSSVDFTFDYALQLSPLLPKEDLRSDSAHRTPATVVPSANMGLFSRMMGMESDGDLETWHAQQVGMWMYRMGFEDTIIDRFELHDITGSVLMDLKFEDLKELGIQSFGKRHQLWSAICSLRGDDQVSPPVTPIEEVVQRKSFKNQRSNSLPEENTRPAEGCFSEPPTPITPGGRKRRGRKHRKNGLDPITPAESVSIVAIEQLIPKPHNCAKGENCPKWKKQQKLYAKLQEEHGFPISPEKGGRIFIAGDPGNASTAPRVVDHVETQQPAELRPTSEAVPSVVASSDLLGPGLLPEFALQEEALRQLEERDAQENVRHFLNLQHLNPPTLPTPVVEHPPSPKFDMFPTIPRPGSAQPLSQLQALPKLTIPRAQSAIPAYHALSPDVRHMEPPSAVDLALSPCHTIITSPLGKPPKELYRYGTPASEMDVPVTAVPVGPVSRDVSQSVPPNMQFRDPVSRTGSRADWRRPSFAMPPLAEGKVFSPAHDQEDESETATVREDVTDIQELRDANAEHMSAYPGVNHAGWMKKRKTKLLRHDWEDRHVRLAGNHLAMHPNALPASSPLDTLNIDDYAVGCSSIASNKLSAKLKALKIANGGKKEEGAAFSFQLVPAPREGEEYTKLRKAVAGGKTHHFAVRTRDERIDWMRELMLAKALKAKRQGYEVHINGSAM